MADDSGWFQALPEPLQAKAYQADRIFTSWNQLDGWLRQVEGLRRVA